MTAVDAYFRAALELGPVAADASTNIDAELRAIAEALEVDAPAIAAALEAKLAASVTTLRVQRTRTFCATETAPVVAAAAHCDGSDAIALCRGACTVNDGATCSPSTVASYIGASPQCDGTCTGSCELAVAAACSGTCRGECSGTCSVRDALGKCAGRCDGGTCLGTCELVAAACAGDCVGSCESETVDGTCAAELRCLAQGGAPIVCDGTCDGEVVVSTSEPACTAAVEARASMRAQCRPPALTIDWQWSAALVDDEPGQAAFKAWLAAHERHHAALLARATEGARILQAAADLQDAVAAIESSIDAALADGPSLAVAVGLDCAQHELPQVAAIVDGETAALRAAVSRANLVIAALGGET